ncbi:MULTISPECIES: hypothetical protein [Nostocaceae]|uniref:Uncharacterized protein n=2 Tax=Nostocaceae TaxID=1162 RepID=A0A3S1AFT0_ANAVA|nr:MULTISPECIES: hypothetical protein [Nostocaceae]MBD2567634.1 hypothetical protein [Anabaena lutea FACHB-196]MBD2625324.1 hypothetical protein [Trichormus variabilis FACHB-164]RUS99696.1 hypothetical protein DSM107003_02800 [Trichormus variabilis SAG 1403-4b]
MFTDELSPIFKQATQHPVSFFGGLFSGVLRLNLADDPVKSWLDKHISSSSSPTCGVQNGKATGPQQISID